MSSRTTRALHAPSGPPRSQAKITNQHTTKTKRYCSPAHAAILTICAAGSPELYRKEVFDIPLSRKALVTRGRQPIQASWENTSYTSGQPIQIGPFLTAFTCTIDRRKANMNANDRAQPISTPANSMINKHHNQADHSLLKSSNHLR